MWLREPDSEPIPGYRLVEPLGTGGFGEVWKCVAPGGINKAIKFVYGNLNSIDDDSAKAEQEFKALERVKEVRHPFVLSMDRIEVVAGELLIVMELADKSLHDLLEEYQQAGRPGIPREMLMGFLADAAEGLDHLIEKHNLQHLDVKPKNLFLIADRVKVADFGLVKHLERQSASGIMGGITPVYAAPETFANKISKHSDQYSLAVVYVEMLSGRRPFAGKNIRQLALQHMTELPDLSIIPEADRAAVARAMSKEPDERFPTCLAFVRALGGAAGRADVTLGDVSIDTPPPLSRHRSDSSPGLRPATIPDIPPPGRHRSSGSDTSSPTTPGIPGMRLSQHDLHLADQLSASAGGSISVTFRPEEGVLRPAILIGVGSFGRRALQQIRCRLLDRVGDLGQMPCFRFIYLDADPDTLSKAATGPTDAALLPEHTFHAPLQPVTAYRRRQLDQIQEWLPREKLYAIPRSLRVDGSRCLGRLAFADHYLRFTTRLRQDLQVCTHPEALSQSADASGLMVKSKVPTVIVFASASGGTGGMLLDIGHAVRRTLDRFNVPDAPVTAHVFAGAPEDPTSPALEQANIFATLTELNHYADPDVGYTGRFGGPDGPQVDARGLPFTACYLLPMAERTSEAFRDCVSHLAGYVAHDLTSPLGTGLESLRKTPAPPGRTPFRGFGTFGVWYPRGLLLRSAARQLCVRVVRDWVGPLTAGVPAEATAILGRVLDDPRLAPESLQEFIAAESSSRHDGNPVERIGQWVSALSEQADAAARRPDPFGWAMSTWDQVRDWIGNEPTVESDSAFRRGRLSRSLDGGLKSAADAWLNEFTEQLRPLDDLAGPRAAAAEAVYAHLTAACGTAADAFEKQLAGFAETRVKARANVQAALEACQSSSESAGGFSLFGGRTARGLVKFADRVRQFAEVRVREDLAGSVVRFYHRLRSAFEDRQRDLAESRQMIDRMTDMLAAPVHLSTAGSTPPNPTAGLADDAEEAMHATLRGSNTIRVVLPYGEDHLDRSAARMLADVPPAEYLRIEQALTKLVVEPRGGLVGVCKTSADLLRHLGGPLVEQATAYLSGLLPAQDVAQVELSSARNDPQELGRRVASYARAAAPLASGPASEERTFVVLPATDPGSVYANEVMSAVPGAKTIPVHGPGTDLLFCREQGCLRTADLSRLLEPCLEAYQDAMSTTETNPHSRYDVTTWVPLVE